jgi:protein tyrosine phosphatase (PTP) superfamily phosphohydrolase (DUF442 family)
MKRNRRSRIVAGLLAFGLLAAACGGDDDDGDASTPADDGGDAADDGDVGADDGTATDDADDGDDGGDDVAAADLASVCPSPLVVQTDWFPEAEHGMLYELIGDDYAVDVENKIVSGSMVLGGEELGIDFEVRTGGPAIGFAPVSSYMYTDDSIHLGYATTDGQVLRYEEAPLLSVLAPLEKNPQIIMWDPETYPDVQSIADIGEAGITVNLFAGGTFADVFVAQGIWSADQIDPSYDGGPARFISEGGAIAQQGFASAEPFTYEFEFEDWGKPVAFELLHDAGFQVYSQTIGIRPDDLETLRPCLEQVVPIMQQAVVDYSASPDRANAIIVDAVEQYADFWVYGPELAEFSIAKQTELGLVGNGPDGTVGNMEEARVQSVIDQIREAGLDIPDDLAVSDLITNEFIDAGIGFADVTADGDDGDDGEDATAAGIDLASVCPSPLVVQTDWFPEAEHGMLYHLIGDDYTVDTDNKIVSGSMVLGGQELGIDFEVRTGGPAIGFAPVSSYMYTDDSIHLGYATTDGQVLRLEEAPLLSVLAPLEKNPQMIMWDPGTYPDVQTLADLGTEGITINVFAGGTFSEVFVAQGLWSADQIDPSYDGGPARFISEGGAIAQQGFASAEVYTYEFEFEDWGKPVAFELLHDAGFQVYSQTIGIRPDDIEDLRPCLEQVVPIMQQAIIDYDASPDRANAIIVDAVEQYADFWVYSPELAAFSVQAQRDNGLIGNGPDDTVGNMEDDRVQSVIDQIVAAGLDVPADISVADIHTNEFIDASIGF